MDKKSSLPQILSKIQWQIDTHPTTAKISVTSTDRGVTSDKLTSISNNQMNEKVAEGMIYLIVPISTFCPNLTVELMISAERITLQSLLTGIYEFYYNSITPETMKLISMTSPDIAAMLMGNIKSYRELNRSFLMGKALFFHGVSHVGSGNKYKLHLTT